MGTDWRDELLMLRDLRRRVGSHAPAFAELVETAADRSSEETARFLRGLNRE
jgi:hypothetical protein